MNELLVVVQLTFGRDRVSVVYGLHILMVGKRSIFLLDKYHISNVLYVHDLPFNLLYVNKIIKELNCELIFTANRCVLQDLVIGRMIEIGLVSDGLYKLPVKVVIALI